MGLAFQVGLASALHLGQDGLLYALSSKAVIEGHLVRFHHISFGKQSCLCWS